MNGFAFTAPRRALAVLSILTCAAALSTAACSSSGGNPVPTAVGTAGTPAASDSTGGAAQPSGAPTGAVTDSPSNAATGATGSSGGGSTAAASPKAAAGLTTCSVRYLNASIGMSQGAAGSAYLNIVFKNLDTRPCTLDGYPGVSFGAGKPVSQVGQPASRDAIVPPRVVTLKPGGSAYAVLRVVNAENYPAADCNPVSTTYLQIYPPNTSNLLYVPYDSKACTKKVVTLAVQAVQAGTGG